MSEVQRQGAENSSQSSPGVTCEAGGKKEAQRPQPSLSLSDTDPDHVRLTSGIPGMSAAVNIISVENSNLLPFF